MWYYFGDCILTPLENLLLGKKNIKHPTDKTGNVSNINLLIRKLTGLPGKIINPIIIFVPIIMIYIIIYKIYSLCNC